MITTEIVIARYNEDLSWLKKIDKNIKITIYNKGNDDINFPFIKLPNIGRESHTYLYHIINNYDNLADITIFCQGDSIFHSPDFLDLIKHVKLFEPIQPLSAFYCPQGEPPNYYQIPPQPLTEQTKNLWINRNPIHVEYMDNEFRTLYPYYFTDGFIIKLLDNIKRLYNVDNILKFYVERFRIKNVNLNRLFPFCYAGIFAVRNNIIRNNSIDFYNNILSTIMYDIRYLDNNKVLDHGYIIERLWLMIFNYKLNNKNYIKLSTKNFPIFNKNIIIKNNSILFKLFIITCNIFIEFYIDNKYHKIFISKYKITFKNKNGNKLVHYRPILNKKIQNLLKDMSTILVDISLNNNIFSLKVNKFKLINYKFINNANYITNAKIFDITNDNNFIDLLIK